MSEQPTPTTPVCCGQLSGAWVPVAGQPQVPACKLCPQSGEGVYWRTAKAATREG